MISGSQLQDVLFLNLETLPVTSEFVAEELIDQHKILCVCVGKIGNDIKEDFLKLRCFYNDDERYMLLEFNSFLEKLKPDTLLYAQNGLAIDFPLLSNRMKQLDIEPADILLEQNNKLAELKVVDNKDFWSFSGIKHYTSLEFLLYLLRLEHLIDNTEDKKQLMDYYQMNDLQRIIDKGYKNVVSIAQLLLRFNNQNTIRTENIYYV